MTRPRHRLIDHAPSSATDGGHYDRPARRHLHARAAAQLVLPTTGDPLRPQLGAPQFTRPMSLALTPQQLLPGVDQVPEETAALLGDQPEFHRGVHGGPQRRDPPRARLAPVSRSTRPPRSSPTSGARHRTSRRSRTGPSATPSAPTPTRTTPRSSCSCVVNSCGAIRTPLSARCPRGRR